MWEGEEGQSLVPEQRRGQYQDQSPRFPVCIWNAVSTDLGRGRLLLTVRDPLPDG